MMWNATKLYTFFFVKQGSTKKCKIALICAEYQKQWSIMYQRNLKLMIKSCYFKVSFNMVSLQLPCRTEYCNLK